MHYRRDTSVLEFAVLKMTIVRNDLMIRWFTALLGSSVRSLCLDRRLHYRKSIYFLTQYSHSNSKEPKIDIRVFC